MQQQLIFIRLWLVTPTDGGSGSGGTPVTTHWGFSDLPLADITFNVQNGGTGYSDGATEVTKVKIDTPYEYTKDGMALKLGGSSGSFNRISLGALNGGVTAEGATEGYVEAKHGIVNLTLQGPFTAKMIAQSNSADDKTDRYGSIKIGDKEYTAEGFTSSCPVAGCVITASYTGTDTVTVSFGGSNTVRISDIFITK